MIVGLNLFVITTRASHDLERSIRDHFVDIHVVRSARAGLKHVKRELLLPLTFNQFFRRLDDCLRDLLIEFVELEVCGCRRLLDLCVRDDQ